MVVWLVRIFFLILAGGIIGGVVLWCREHLCDKVCAAAVVEQKLWSKFPRTVISARRDTMECYVEFRLTAEDRLVRLPVTKDVYDQLQKEDVGILTYQGDGFRSFERHDGVMIQHILTPDTVRNNASAPPK